jgi:hypothetical protein
MWWPPPLLLVRRGSLGPPLLPLKFADVPESGNDCSVLRSEMVPGARSAVLVVVLREALTLLLEARWLPVRARLGVLRVAVVVWLLRAVRDEPDWARLIVGTPLDVVFVGVEREVVRGRLELDVPPVLRLGEPLLGVCAGLPDERLTPPDERLEPDDFEMPPEDRLALPDERLVPPDDLLVVPPDDRLALPDERLVPPEDLLVVPPDDRLVPPDDRLTPPEDREPALGELPDERLLLLPPDDLTPPLERELPPPLDARWASTRFTGAANRATANTANRKKKIRLGVSISDLRLSV